MGCFDIYKNIFDKGCSDQYTSRRVHAVRKVRKRAVSLPRLGTGSHKAGSNAWHSSRSCHMNSRMSWEIIDSTTTLSFRNKQSYENLIHRVAAGFAALSCTVTYCTVTYVLTVNKNHWGGRNMVKVLLKCEERENT